MTSTCQTPGVPMMATPDDGDEQGQPVLSARNTTRGGVGDRPHCHVRRCAANAPVVGCVGSLIVATRGVAGAGEVLLKVRGSKEAYLAWSEEPLPRGTEVLVIDIRGARTVLVEPWPGPDFLTQIP